MGCLCVLAGSGATGWQLLRQRRRGLEEWTELLDALRLMERELRCREPTVPELLETLSQRSGGNVRRWFSACSGSMAELGERPFARLWQESLAAAEFQLPRQEQAMLRNLGEILGRYDRETQCETLLRLTAESEERLRRVRGELQRCGKLYLTISVAGGVLLVVLAC